MDNTDFVNIPTRRVKAKQNFNQDEVKIYSMDDVADKVLHRKKKSKSALGIDVFAETDETDEVKISESEYRSQLSVLQDDSNLQPEHPNEDMEDLLRTLHLRTQHLIGKVTPAGMNRLAATNHVATAAVRLKNKYRLDSQDLEEDSPSPTEEQSRLSTKPAKKASKEERHEGRSKKSGNKSSPVEIKPAKKSSTNSRTTSHETRKGSLTQSSLQVSAPTRPVTREIEPKNSSRANKSPRSSIKSANY